MAKVRDIYVCRSCGSAQARWQGKCPDCGAWDSLEQTRLDPAAAKDPQQGLVGAWASIQGDGDGPSGADAGARPLREIESDGPGRPRLSTGMGELDRVLGGWTGVAGVAGAASGAGLVPGSAVLIGGPPGIGKSTLLLHAARAMARGGTRVLYVSSEESAEQVKLRSARLDPGRGDFRRDGAGTVGAGDDGFDADERGDARSDASERRATRQDVRADDRGDAELFILADTNLARIVEQCRKVMPRVMVIDSIQMVYKSDIPAAPGSVAQVRRCASDLVFLAKHSGIAVVMVGHVTKDGQLAGPRLLEHLVDVVLSFEGDRYHAHRLVRGVKNRFGATSEIGIFEMTADGLREVPEGAGVPAVTLAQSSGGKPRPGSVVCPVMTGTRCVLVEVQALTATGFPGAAKRKSSGLDPNRLAMLIAVLEQHAGMHLADRDVFASAVGGLRVHDPAADLALLLAIGGAHRKRALDVRTAAVGEVGLGGEVRPVPQLDERVREAGRLGYSRVIVPAPVRAEATPGARSRGGPEMLPVRTIDAALDLLS